MLVLKMSKRWFDNDFKRLVENKEILLVPHIIVMIQIVLTVKREKQKNIRIN